MQESPGYLAGVLAPLVAASETAQPLSTPLLPMLLPPVGRRILIVDDDAPLARLLGSGLMAALFSVDLVHDGEAAARMLDFARHDLVILDLNLPKMDGLTLLQRLRTSQPLLPVLVLTGRCRTEDLVRSLDEGADDCLLKPFSLKELMARVRGLLRRSVAPLPEPLLLTGALPLVLNRDEYRVERNGRQIDLTPREFTVLEFLMLHAGKPLSRATLMKEVWNMPLETNTNIVDVYMKYLRDKIDGEGEEKLIQTVRGVGYVLRNG